MIFYFTAKCSDIRPFQTQACIPINWRKYPILLVDFIVSQQIPFQRICAGNPDGEFPPFDRFDRCERTRGRLPNTTPLGQLVASRFGPFSLLTSHERALLTFYLRFSRSIEVDIVFLARNLGNLQAKKFHYKPKLEHSKHFCRTHFRRPGWITFNFGENQITDLELFVFLAHRCCLMNPRELDDLRVINKTLDKNTNLTLHGCSQTWTRFHAITPHTNTGRKSTNNINVKLAADCMRIQVFP